MEVKFDIIEYNGKPHFLHCKDGNAYVFESIFAFNGEGAIDIDGARQTKKTDTLEAKDFVQNRSINLHDVSESKQNWFSAFLCGREKLSYISAAEFAQWQKNQANDFLDAMRDIFSKATGLEPAAVGFTHFTQEADKAYFRFGVTPETNLISTKRDFSKNANTDLIQSLLPAGLTPVIQTQYPTFMNPR